MSFILYVQQGGPKRWDVFRVTGASKLSLKGSEILHTHTKQSV